MHARRVPASEALQSPGVDALLAFAAALVSLRLSARARASASGPEEARARRLVGCVGRLRARSRRPGVGRRVRLDRRPHSGSYYLGGALLTAPLLGVGSLLLVGRRWFVPVAFAYVGLAVGVAVAAPLHGSLSGTDVPQAQDLLALWPARVVAIAANSLGTLVVVVVALATIRRRPLGNALILAGIGVAALGSALAGLGVGALAPDRGRGRPPPLRRVHAADVASRSHDRLPARQHPQPADGVEHHQREQRELRAKRVAASSKSATARSCATASPATCPTTSAPTWTYQTVFGVRIVSLGW